VYVGDFPAYSKKREEFNLALNVTLAAYECAIDEANDNIYGKY
jgi:hypothetical protein